MSHSSIMQLLPLATALCSLHVPSAMVNVYLAQVGHVHSFIF